jgi:UDP-2,3-diacylglucosamine pyrophosphatase LpxH
MIQPDSKIVLSDSTIGITYNKGFEEGKEYHISVQMRIKMVTIPNPFVYSHTYIAVKHSLDFKDQSTIYRNQVVCISDIHLGYDSVAEIRDNKDSLVLFLNQIRNSSNVMELVIAGDLFDGWFLPGSDDAAGRSNFINSIARYNKNVLDALKVIMDSTNIIVTYVPGNHDLLFTAAEITKILPKIKQKRDRYGLGTYSPIHFPTAAIEHSHRYDIFCAPDTLSNLQQNNHSILPPGYFYTRIAATSVVERKVSKDPVPAKPDRSNFRDSCIRFGYEYMDIWNNTLITYKVNESNDLPFIKVNVGGLNNNYSISDILPVVKAGKAVAKLYNSLGCQWAARQKLNLVPVLINTDSSLIKTDSYKFIDDMSYKQYFNVRGNDKRVVVFGHTHMAGERIYNSIDNKKAVYANTGTWIDLNPKSPYGSMTFVVLSAKPIGSQLSFVGLYKFNGNNPAKKIDEQALRD